MADEYQFNKVDARQDPQTIQRQLRRAMSNFLEMSNFPVPLGTDE